VETNQSNDLNQFNCSARSEEMKLQVRSIGYITMIIIRH